MNHDQSQARPGIRHRGDIVQPLTLKGYGGGVGRIGCQV